MSFQVLSVSVAKLYFYLTGSVKEFSSETVVALLVQIVLILIDRYIYLSKVIQKLKAKGDKSNALIFEYGNITHNKSLLWLSLIHICRCRRIERCRSRWSPYH
eukprot:TRINITY_DN14664_c0_g1_i2.p2 TRINITY_DN14664_c0_g1~~TRINITY_DN14664_c0_g1_i2.p2  ORF type:complete len:103 (+),score=19.04 TRINITY_DN14664_c0_g1_i2:402-710(+)